MPYSATGLSPASTPTDLKTGRRKTGPYGFPTTKGVFNTPLR